MAKRTRFQSAAEAAVDWLIDKGIARWPSIASLGVGGLMTYLAAISNSLAPYGPVAWGAVGLASFVLASAGTAAFSWAYERRAMAIYARRASLGAGTNLLAPTHEDERILLSAFYHPYQKPVEHVRFENCELFGPSIIVLQSCTLIEGGFYHCDVVIVREDQAPSGAIYFRHCHFLRFSLYRATLLMTWAMYNDLPANLRSTVPVISDHRKALATPSTPDTEAGPNPPDESEDPVSP